MARTRNRRTELDTDATVGSVSNNNEGESNMSELAFTEPLTADEWTSEGGAGTAARGLYSQVLVYVRDSGQRYHRIPMDRGPFAGKKPASVATALKNAQKAKNAPTGVDEDTIKITSRGANEEKGTKGVVYIENTAVEDTEQ